MIKRNQKLWEAIGLFLVLLAWTLEWQSLRKWEQVEKRTMEFITSFTQAVGAADDRFERQFQFATSRAVQNITLDPKDINHAYITAWKYAEVRKALFDQTMANLLGVQELLKNISQISSRNSLDLPKTYGGIEVRYKDLMEELNRSANGAAITPDQVAQLRGKISELIIDSIKPLNELLETIRMKIRLNSQRHGALFVLGSFFLIAAKLIGWWEDRNIPDGSKLKTSKGVPKRER